MKKIVWKCALFLIGFICCYPIVFVCVGSFMGKDELLTSLRPALSSSGGYVDWSILPQEPTLRSWVEVLLDTPGVFVTFWNSIQIVVGVLLGQLLVAVPGAWGFAKYKFPFHRALFLLYVILMMMPFQVLMLSEYLVLDKLNLLNTLWALILPGIFSTFPVFILYNSFRGIPNEILEAGRIDGASEWQLFLEIGLSLGKSGIFSVIVLSFLEYWNLVEQPMTFLKDKVRWPMSIFLPSIEPENAGITFVASVISLIPALLVFLSGQEYLEKGISYMGMKE